METEHEFYIVRTSAGKEEKFLDAIAKVISKRENHGIYSLFAPETVRGYVFAEAENLQKVVDAVRGVPNNKGVIRSQVDFAELEKYFEKEGEQIVVHERDIVEMIAGPFKGDRAKVVRVVPGKDEVIIEPLNMAVPIPITLSLDDIRVIEQNKKEE
ncbi:MAG: transcription elongation factor Spt5 [Nanoarchaeota archaeon]